MPSLKDIHEGEFGDNYDNDDDHKYDLFNNEDALG